jgi:VWFA-related protein
VKRSFNMLKIGSALGGESMRAQKLLRFFVLAAMFCPAAALAQQSGAPAKPGADAIFLDVVVTSKSREPVSGLQQQDFKVLDNKVPQGLTSFQALGGAQAPIEVVLVVDDVNTGIEHVAYERSEMDKFLRANGGHLAYPTTLAYVSDSGLQVEQEFSRDGNSLDAALDQHMVSLHTIRRSAGFYGAVERYEISLQALDQLAKREASRPGRKLILWISPGWPYLSGPGIEQQLDAKQEQQIYDDVVRFSTLLRMGRITLYSIDPLGTADFGERTFYWESFMKGISKPSQAQGGDLALQVLATQSGGLALTANNDIAAQLQQCLADAQAYYELSFAPSVENPRDAYHHVEVRVDKPGLVARTRQGYYTATFSQP